MSHPLSARFHEILKELGDLHDKKQADYGRDNDPFANVRASTEWGLEPWVGAMVRLNDKVRRLQALVRNGALVNESAEDSLRDIAVYAVIALVLREQEPTVSGPVEIVATISGDEAPKLTKEEWIIKNEGEGHASKYPRCDTCTRGYQDYLSASN